MNSFRELQVLYEDRIGDTYNDNTNKSYTPRNSNISYDPSGLKGIKADQYGANFPSSVPVGEQEEEVDLSPECRRIYDKVIEMIHEAEKHDMQYAINQLAELKRFICKS